MPESSESCVHCCPAYRYYLLQISHPQADAAFSVFDSNSGTPGCSDAGYPIGTFVRKQALREKLEVNYNIVADLGEIQNLTVQAAGIGNNLNQIARYFHGGGLASRGMLEELKKCIAEIRELRQEIVQLGGAYRGNSKTHRK